MEFWEIYDQYYPKIRRFILTLTRDEWAADDLLQETFLRVQHNMDQLRDPARLSPWIFRIAYNLCQDHFRRTKTASREQSLDQEDLFAEGDIQKEMEQREMEECVQNQVSLLPDLLRTVLVLFDIMGFTHQEIAETLGITVENVKVKLHRARKKLKTILEEKCAFERDERDVLVCLPADQKPGKEKGPSKK
jgi:RNA polymerase sigma-70 factor (ECF subfamily)